MKAIARSYIFQTGMDTQTENLTKNLINVPWERIDAYSIWPEIIATTSTRASKMVQLLEIAFWDDKHWTTFECYMLRAKQKLHRQLTIPLPAQDCQESEGCMPTLIHRSARERRQPQWRCLRHRFINVKIKEIRKKDKKVIRVLTVKQITCIYL